MGTGEGWLVLFPIQIMALHVWMITVPFRCVAVGRCCATASTGADFICISHGFMLSLQTSLEKFKSIAYLKLEAACWSNGIKCAQLNEKNSSQALFGYAGLLCCQLYLLNAYWVDYGYPDRTHCPFANILLVCWNVFCSLRLGEAALLVAAGAVLP